MSTPGRVTRQRSKTPLPTVVAKQSHAYGSRGKAELRSQIRGGTSDFASAFAGGRSVPAGGASTAPSASVRSASPEEAKEAEEPAPAQPVAVQPTAMDSMAAYEGGMVAKQRSENDRERPVAVQNNLRALFWLFGLFCLLSGFLISALPLPSLRLEAGRHNIISGLKQIFHTTPYDVPPADLAYRWFRFQHDQMFLQEMPGENMPGLQWSININFLARLEKLEARVAALESELHLTNNSLSEIHRLLPDLVLLRNVHGHYEIPDDLWEALQERMVEDSDLAPRWQAFILRNEEAIKQLQREQLQGMLDSAVESRHLVTREIFMSAIQQNNDFLAHEYSQELKKMWQYNMDNLKAFVKQEASELIDRSEMAHFAKAQLSLLSKANSLHNTYEALRGVNFFSAHAGARIDPSITSPNATPKQLSFLSRLWTKINPRSDRINPPIYALAKWDEATECWCGSSTTLGGPVNIGVLPHHRVYPERLVIEHIPGDGTLDITAAPREFEVWADAGSKKAAAAYETSMAVKDEIVLTPRCGPKPKAGFVCIGQGEYDIHGNNHVQSFKLWDRAEELGLPGTGRFVVRVISNWGGHHTCIYRVRLTGMQA